MNADDLLYVSREPLNAETPLARQVGVITPAERHYVRDHFAIPRGPDRLDVDGAVATPLQLELDHIRSLAPRSLIEMAGPRSSAVEVLCVGADVGTPADVGADRVRRR